MKDAGASVAIERYLAREIQDFGELKNFRINSRDKSLEVEVLLKGEEQPISIHVQKYELIEDSKGDYVVIREVRASREWLTVALNKFILGRRHPLPQQYSKLIRMVLHSSAPSDGKA